VVNRFAIVRIMLVFWPGIKAKSKTPKTGAQSNRLRIPMI
jgi:hypothetical protein